MNKTWNRFVSHTLCRIWGAEEKVRQAVEELRSDERGLSGVVVAILLILVAVLAVVMIWKFLGGYLQEVFTRITDADTI